MSPKMSEKVIGLLERGVALLEKGMLNAEEFAALKCHILLDIAKPAELGNCAQQEKQPAKRQALNAMPTVQPGVSSVWWTHDNIVSTHIMQWLDLDSVIRCRTVCSRWKWAVATAGLQPLEAGKSKDQIMLGFKEQQQVQEAFQREHTLWADDVHKRGYSKLANNLEEQQGLNSNMREILVGWLLELHCNFFSKHFAHLGVVHLAVQLLDRFLAIKQVSRRDFQGVGAVAFGISCAANQYKELALTETHCASARKLQGDDLRVTNEYLLYMCDGSYTRRQLERFEKDMLCSLRLSPVIPRAFSPLNPHPPKMVEGIREHPTPADFVARFAEAAGFSPLHSLFSISPPSNTEFYDSAFCTFTATRILVFLLDVVVLRVEFCRYRASQVCAACVMSVLRLRQLAAGNVRAAAAEPDSLSDGAKLCLSKKHSRPFAPEDSHWSPHLAYYTCYSLKEVAPISDEVLAWSVDVSETVMRWLNTSEPMPGKAVNSISQRYTAEFLEALDAVLREYIKSSKSCRPTRAQVS